MWFLNFKFFPKRNKKVDRGYSFSFAAIANVKKLMMIAVLKISI